MFEAIPRRGGCKTRPYDDCPCGNFSLSMMTSFGARFFTWLAVPIIVVLDQVTKFWIVGRYYLWEVDPILGDLIRITRVHNPGAAFGIAQDYPGFFRILTGIAIAVIALHKAMTVHRHLLYQAALGLVLSGAIGNMIDRVLYNHVVDFVDVGLGDWRWPAFNVADAAISIGVVLLLIESFRRPAEPAAVAINTEA